jgi:hypothetical protein
MATTYSAIGEAGTRNNARYLGVALLVIATAQLWSSSTVSSAPNARTTAALRAAAYQHALAASFDRGLPGRRRDRAAHAVSHDRRDLRPPR